MIVKLPYGRTWCTCDVRGLRILHLKPAVTKSPAPQRVLEQAFSAPAVGPVLVDVARGKGAAVILVPDTTRRVPLPAVLPLVLAELARAGIAAHRVTVLVASGTHPPVEEALLRNHLGPLPPGVEVIQHQARREEDLVPVGKLEDGTPVRLHRRVVETPCLLSVFTVQHHYFAGFGGGPKLVFPGVAGYEEIQRNHSRVMDLGVEPPRLHPCCQPGVLENNPVAEEIRQVARLRPVDWSLAMVLDQQGVVAWADAGEGEAVWLAAVEQVRQWYEVAAETVSRIVVSAGGYPSDFTLIQAHKALDAASRWLVPGGEMLFVADLGGGPGSPAMEPFLDDPRPEAIARKLRDRYVQYGHTTWRIVDKSHRFRIFLYSRLSRHLVRSLGFLPVEEPQEVVERWRAEGSEKLVGVMPGAPVYPAR
ncbi:MAG: lactate racemase domain-containing protein [Thermoanaerobaculum sp.]|nr:lactate racemase domain-containing protein [Thermoanaerobaculum sp.]